MFGLSPSTARALGLLLASIVMVSSRAEGVSGGRTADDPGAEGSRNWAATPFDLLARHLRTAEIEQRRAFARIALEELIHAYGTEVQLTSGERRSAAGSKYHRWLRATHSFVTDLQGTYAALGLADVVSLTVRPPEKVRLLVDGRLVVIAGPRIGASRPLENRIRARFCRDWNCDTPAPRDPKRSVPKQARSEPVWSFRDGGRTSCETEDGIVIEFSSRHDLSAKRAACAQLVNELREISGVLATAGEGGALVQWETVAIRSLGRGRPEQLLLNERGDYLLGSWPYLAGSTTLVQRSRPWLKAQHAGHSHRLLISDLAQHIPHIALPVESPTRQLTRVGN